MSHPGLLHPEPLPLRQATADLFPHRRCSSLAQSLRVSWCTQVFVWALKASLAGMGFDSKCDFASSTVLLGLLLFPWTWGIFFCWKKWNCFYSIWQSTRTRASCVTQPHMCTCPLPFGFPPRSGHHSGLSRVLCVIWWVLINIYLNIVLIAYMSVPISQFFPLSPFFHNIHIFLLYICVSISALQIRSSMLFS